VQGEKLHVRRSFSAGRESSPKNGRGRAVPLASELRITLERPRERQGAGDDDYAFGGLQRPSGDALRSSLYRALDDAGLGHYRTSEPRFVWHSLRHSWASQCVRAGVPLTALQTWGGWSSLAILSRYSHWREDESDADLISRAVA
jgi:integrase